MSAIEIEAQCRVIRARIEGQLFPQLWIGDLITLAGLERRLVEIYAAQRRPTC